MIDFQDLNPQLFVTVGEVLGDAMAGNLPFNVQNAIGNWLQLVGQAILTYNAQQQYFQSGPGRFYNEAYRDVTNPFTPPHPSTEITKELNHLKESIEALQAQVNKLIK